MNIPDYASLRSAMRRAEGVLQSHSIGPEWLTQNQAARNRAKIDAIIRDIRDARVADENGEYPGSGLK